jgi:hypothetical protein
MAMDWMWCFYRAAVFLRRRNLLYERNMPTWDKGLFGNLLRHTREGRERNRPAPRVARLNHLYGCSKPRRDIQRGKEHQSSLSNGTAHVVVVHTQYMIRIAENVKGKRGDARTLLSGTNPSFILLGDFF